MHLPDYAMERSSKAALAERQTHRQLAVDRKCHDGHVVLEHGPCSVARLSLTLPFVVANLLSHQEYYMFCFTV